MVSSAAELSVVTLPTSGFRPEHPPRMPSKPPGEYATHPLFQDASQQITNALQPENFLQYHRVLKQIEFGGPPIMQYEVAPALRALERGVLLDHGLTWTPQMSVYFLKRAGGRLAAVESIYREARKKYNIDQNLQDAALISRQVAQDHANLQLINQKLASQEATYDERLKLALEEFDGQHEVRDLDRQELGRLYGQICDHLLTEFAKLSKIEAFPQPEVDRLFVQTRKEIITENTGLSAKPFLRALDEAVEARISDRTRWEAGDRQQRTELINVTPPGKLAALAMDELHPKECEPWNQALLVKVIEKNPRIKEVLVDLLLRKRSISKESSPVFTALEADLKRSKAGELDKQKAGEQKELQQKRDSLEKDIPITEDQEKKLREEAEALDAVTSQFVGKIVDEVVEDYLAMVKDQGKEKLVSAFEVYNSVQSAKAATGGIEKSDAVKLLRQCWKNLKDTIPADKTAAIQELFDASLGDNLPNLRTRFERLVAILGEQHTGWVTTYETTINNQMSNVSYGGLFWGNSFHNYDTAAVGRAIELDMTTDKVIDGCFYHSETEFNSEIGEDKIDEQINRKMNAVVALATAAELVRAYGMRLAPDNWHRIDPFADTAVIARLDVVDRRRNNIQSEKGQYLDLQPIFSPDSLLEASQK